MPIDTDIINDTWKVGKFRLQQSYKYSSDEFIQYSLCRSVASKARSAILLDVEKALLETERDSLCVLSV